MRPGGCLCYATGFLPPCERDQATRAGTHLLERYHQIRGSKYTMKLSAPGYLENESQTIWSGWLKIVRPPRPTAPYLKLTVLTVWKRPLRINSEVHVGWCPPGTSNPVDLPLVDRSVRFRHTSANSSAPRSGLCPGAGVRTHCNRVHSYEPQQAAEERSVQRMEGSEAPGARAGRPAATHPPRRKSPRQTAQAQEARRRRRAGGHLNRNWRRGGFCLCDFLRLVVLFRMALSGPEGRKILAHAASRGIRLALKFSQVPAGAKDMWLGKLA